MKKLFLLFSIVLFAACASDDITEQEEQQTLDSQTRSADTGPEFQPEEAFPDAQKELYTCASGVIVEKLDSLYILDGDIMLSKEQMAILDNPVQPRGAVYTGVKKFWRNDIVYYTFDPDFNSSYREYVKQAIAEIETACGVRFKYATADDKNYIRFIHGDGYWSYVGMIGGQQDITIQEKPNSSIIGHIMHEICHALGFYHEHNRADRDNYITILWNNIQTDKQQYYKTYAQLGYPGMDIFDFDFNSIMLYSSKSGFSTSTGLNTMVDKNGASFIGKRQELSDLNIKTLKAIYGPPYTWYRKPFHVVDASDDGITKINHVETKLYADFFSDAACTKSTYLPQPRIVRIRITERFSPYENFNANYETIVVPSGVNTYLLGTGVLIERIRDGKYIEYHEKKYDILL